MITFLTAFTGLVPAALLSISSANQLRPGISLQASRPIPAPTTPAAANRAPAPVVKAPAQVVHAPAPVTTSKTPAPVPKMPAAAAPVPAVMLSPAVRYQRDLVFDMTSRRDADATSPKGAADARAASALRIERDAAWHDRIDMASTTFGTYGPAIGGDALGNTTIGGPVGPLKFCIRFRAEQSSPLVSLTMPFVSADYPGYGAGTGGDWTLKLFADDGTPEHFPSGPALASRSLSALATSITGREITFASPYTTEAGTIYHFVIENVDANPKVNYFSVNCWVRLSFTEGGSLNPRGSDFDWGNGYYHAGRWHERTGACPIADIEYGNGAHQGMCYGEASYGCVPGQPCIQSQAVGHIEGASSAIREKFTVSGGDQVVGGVGIRLLRDVNAAGDLIVSLRNGTNREIASARVPASAVAVGPAPKFAIPPSWDDLGQNARWATANFDDLVVLEHGQTYFLQFSSEQGSYWAWVQRRLTPDYPYSPMTAFADGHAEYTIDGATWQPLGRVAKQNDLQFYFSTVVMNGTMMAEEDAEEEVELEVRMEDSRGAAQARLGSDARTDFSTASQGNLNSSAPRMGR